ncbi:MAG: nucleotidyltransferase family protein [Pseudomonadota bacterium]
MAKVAAIILAAGLSRRMGAKNKLLLPVRGRPMIAGVVGEYLGAAEDVRVVTGHEAERVGQALADLPVKLVHNPDFESGQPSSVAAGLRSLDGQDLVLVGLGDQVDLRSRHIEALLKAHFAHGGRKISVPHSAANRGNPIVIPGAMVAQILDDGRNPGCGRFTRENPDLVEKIAFEDPAYFTDVDTPEAYRALSPQIAEARA